VANLKFTIVL